MHNDNRFSFDQNVDNSLIITALSLIITSQFSYILTCTLPKIGRVRQHRIAIFTG